MRTKELWLKAKRNRWDILKWVLFTLCMAGLGMVSKLILPLLALKVGVKWLCFTVFMWAVRGCCQKPLKAFISEEVDSWRDSIQRFKEKWNAAIDAAQAKSAKQKSEEKPPVK